MVVVVVRDHDRIDIRKRVERQPGWDEALRAEAGDGARVAGQEWVRENRQTARPDQERRVPEPRQAVGARGREARDGLGTGQNVAQRDRGRRRVDRPTQKERHEFGESGCLGRASLGIAESHAARGYRRRRDSIPACRSR